MKQIYKSGILFLCILFLSTKINSQNLVNNPSFESVNSGSLMCSWYLTSAEFAAAITNWTNPTGGSTDIFNTSLATTCFCSPFSTNGSSPGTQAPRTGNTMCALFVYGNGGCSPYREYVQGTLSSALVPGQQYCIEFYVSLADNSQYAVNNIGLAFSTSLVNNTSMCVYSVVPQVNYTGPIITDKLNWSLISLTFTPTVAYTSFIIGNFYNDVSTTSINVGGTVAQTRYFIDDVDIHLCSTNPVVSVTNDTICSGQTATLAATSTVTGTTFLWNTGATTSNINVTPTTTTVYTVTGTTSTGSTASATATVTVNLIPVISSSASPNTICNGETSSLSASSTLSGTSYSWMPGNLAGSPVTIAPTLTTTYTVTGTLTGCTGSTTVSINVNPIPIVTASASPTTICSGQSSTLTAGGATTYQWMLGALVGTPVTVTPTLNTTYTVTGTASGCTGSTTVSITVNPIPIVTASASPTSICSGQTATLTANGATTFLWMPGNLTGSPINVTPTSTTIYTVTGTTSGCTATATTTVTLNPAMVITPSASPASICNGATASLTASSSAAGTTFVWLPGGLSGSPISVTPASTTTYTVNGVSAAGCTGSASIVLTVNQNITVTATASPATICNGSASTLSASSSIPGTSFVWLPGSLSGSNINVTPNMTSNYIVEGTSPDGCSGSAAVVVTCYNAATVGIYGLPYNGCSPLDVTFNFAPVNLVANSTWHWDFDDLYSSNNTSSDSTGHHVYQHHGNFNVLFSAQDTNGCAISATTTIEVYVVPQADFEYDPQIGIAEILPITFDDISIDANYWLWDFGDPNSYNDNNSDLENPVHMYADSGMYTVQLIVTTDHNCSDTTSQLITINPGILFYVPNAFTPNGDDKNEVFKPIITGIDKSTYQLFIFDRWGKQAFYSNNLDIAWDGKYNGKDVPEGVFSYIIQFNEYSGKRHKYVGSITLFR
ncbi:MAG: PKD domain-containing protein [Bacteroidota bacterium]